MREGVIEIDGARGEGGGQILRTSLALAMITGRPLRMVNIRANRARPGLRRQHVACVEAAARLSGAHVRGAEVGAATLDFTPGAITGGGLEIDIGSAGSTTLVVQTILVPAIVAGHPLRAVIRGGTHNPLAPPFEFLDRVYLPQLRAMGADVTLTLERHGFANGDGRKDHGQLTLTVGGGRALRPIERVTTGAITARRATVITARLPTHVAERELAVVDKRLGFTVHEHEVREVDGGPANVVMLEIERDGGAVRELVTSLGERHLRAEVVAQRACDDLAAYLAADVPVGAHLADQLLLPLAVAGGGRFRAAALSLHATTNLETIQHFLAVAITVASDGTVTVGA